MNTIKKTFGTSASLIAIAVLFVASLSLILAKPALAATSTNLIQNSGFEQTGTAAGTANLWQPFNSGYTLTSATAHTGTNSIQLQSANATSLFGASQRIDLNQTSVEPVFIGAYVKGTGITMAAGSNFGASIYAEIHFTDGSVMYWNSVPNQGTFDWRWIGFNTGSGFTTATGLIPVTKPIAYIFVVPLLGDASGTAYFDDITVQQFAPTQGAITLMFDDGNSTDDTIAKPTLDSYGIKGTSAIITSEAAAPETGTMGWTQVHDLASDGWDIVSHTVTHPDLTTLTLANATTELSASKAALVAQGFTINSIAFPFGAYNGDILGITQQYYASSRSFEAGDNPLGVFPYDIKIHAVVASTTLADVQSWIAADKANKQWGVYVIHLISAAGDDEYHIDPTTFKSIVAAVAQSGLPLLTYDQGIATYGVSGSGVPIVIPPPVITPPTPPATTPLGGSCSASSATTTIQTTVTWTANPTGGTGTYAYLWSGTNLSGTSKTEQDKYSSVGTKYSTVVITSGTSTITKNCSIQVVAAPVAPVTPPTPPTQPPTPPSTTCAQGKSASLSTSLSGNGTVKVTNNSSNCTYSVGLASYKVYDTNENDLNSQTLFASQTATIQPKASTTLTVPLPSCLFQLDFFTGAPITSFTSSGPYGSRLISSVVQGGAVCTK